MSERNTLAATPWIYSRGLDLTIGCAGWSVLLLFLAYPVGGVDLGASAVVFYALALVCNYPHYMATIHRAYQRSDFERYRLFTLYISVLLLLTLVAAHMSFRLVPLLFTLYLTWSPWHYMSQNYGLMMMFIGRNGITVGQKDRNALRTSFVASYFMMFLTLHTQASPDIYVLSLGLPPLLDVLRLPLLFIFAILGIYPLGKLARQAGWRKMQAAIVLYVAEFLWFVLPTVLELAGGIQLPQTRYSAGILAVMHSAQYIWITSYYAQREAGVNESGSTGRRRYFATLVVGGIALFVPGPWLTSYAFGHDFTTSFFIFTALVNIHHFILDGALWKLREKRVASILLNSGPDEKPATVKTWRGTIGSRWRYVQIGAVAVLLILAGVDQIRNYLVTGLPDPSTLNQAARMNPYDALLQSRLGLAHALAGDPDGAVSAFQRCSEVARRSGNTFLAHACTQRAGQLQQATLQD